MFTLFWGISGQFGGARTVVWPCPCVENACTTHIKRTHSIEYNIGLVPIFEQPNYGKLAPIFWFPTLAAPSSLAYSWNDDPLIQGMGEGATMRNEFANGLDEKAFKKYLDDLHQQEDNNEPMDDSEFFTEADDTAPVSFADANIVGFPPYLADTVTFGADEDYQEIPKVNAFNNGYVQIVHSNGIHHLAMVSCCYVLYHRSNSVSISTQDAPQMHS